jgi:hypothetical protein
MVRLHTNAYRCDEFWSSSYLSISFSSLFFLCRTSLLIGELVTSESLFSHLLSILPRFVQNIKGSIIHTNIFSYNTLQTFQRASPFIDILWYLVSYANFSASHSNVIRWIKHLLFSRELLHDSTIKSSDRKNFFYDK